MSPLEALWVSPLVHRFGCGLLHFLWQGLLIAMVLAVAMRLLRGRSAGGRYLTAWAALLAMAAAVPITAWLTSPPLVTELAGATAEPPGVWSPTDSARKDGWAIPWFGTGEARIPAPGVATPVELAAAASSGSSEDPRAASGAPLVVRASQLVRPALPWVVCCWVMGTLALALWRLGGWVGLRRLCCLGTRPASNAAGQMLGRLVARLGIHRAVRLLESTLVEVPTVIGWLRPVILLPASILAELPAEQLELILAHELAHVRRHDFLLNLLQTAIETLLFYHPAVWWVSRRIRIEREACCDDLAVAGCGDRLLYARALTRLEELRHKPAGLLPANVGMAADGAPLLSRVRRVLGLPGDDQEGRRTWLGGSIAVLLLLGALVGYVATAGEVRLKPADKAAAEATKQPGGDPAAGPSSASSSSIPEWGEAVEGVQVRLRATQSRWNEGRVVRLWANVRNQGTRNVLITAWGPSCELEVDGQWYRMPPRGGTQPAPRPFPPGRQYDDIAVDLGQGWELKTSQDARRPGEAQPEQLKLTAGKHTICVAFTATAAKNAPGEPVRAVSNPVVIEIISAKEIAARPGRLKSQKNAFELRLAYHGPRDNPNQSGVENPLRSLILHTTLVDIQPLWGWSAISISEEQAARIVDHLQVEGSLVDALPFTEDRPPPDLDGPAYSLTIKGPENLVLYKPVGWGLSVLDFLERLQTVVDGDAAEALDQLMARLEPHRPEWEAVAKWGQAVEGVQVRLRAQQPQWKLGTTPQFYADIRNLGTRNLLVYRAGNFWTSSELEVDGRWYRRRLPEHDYRPPLSDLVPGRQFDSILVDLGRGWYPADSPSRDAEGTGVTESQPGQLELAPGKHTFRVAVTMPLGGNRPGDHVRVISNPVEIEIVTDASEKVGAAPGGNADVTTALPSVETTGAKRDDQTAPVRQVGNPVKRETPPGGPGSSAATRPRYAGEGLVVDDVTGKPVEQIAIQEGVPNPGAESGIMWITAIQSPKGVAGGRFDVTHGWVKEGKVRIRIVADGYLPEVAIVDTEDGLLKAPLVMRLRRGEAIRGRVIDHAGKPLAGAEVFLGGPDRHAEIVDGKIEEGLGGKRETTDTDGRFVIHGAAPGEVNRLVVLAPELHVWMLPVLELGKELTVKLPEPATLVLRYDIPGDVPEGRFRLELKTWDMPDWKGIVRSVQNPTPKNQGEVVLKNMTPGVYDVIRMKQLRVADRGTEAFCDRRDVTLQSGKTTTLQFVRQKAFAIEGDVVGLEGTGIEGAFVFVRSPKATGDPESRDDWKLPIYDGATSGIDGKFKTAPIEPGEYLLVADAYKPQPRGMGFGMGWTLPAYVGTAKVTVPEDGPPPRVRIEMKPRAAGQKAPPATAPAKASAEATGETPPTNHDRPVSLAQAIETFNAEAAADPVGRAQPPLTEEEVVAAIRAAKPEKDSAVFEELFRALKRIAETRVLPPKAEFATMTLWDPGEAFVYDVWWVRIEMPKEEGGGYSIPIRERRIRSRTLEEEIQRLEKVLQETPPEPGRYRLEDRLEELKKRASRAKNPR